MRSGPASTYRRHQVGGFGRGVAAAVLTMNSRPHTPGRLKGLFDATIAGEAPRIGADDLKCLQALALNTVQFFFTDPSLDAPLKHEVGRKQLCYSHMSPPDDVRETVMGPRDTAGMQLDSLNFLLRTFQDRTESDSCLRREVMDKLATMGRLADIDAIMPYVRHHGASDLYHGTEAIKGITARLGSPQVRGGLRDDPYISRLLDCDLLQEPEKEDFLAAVLRHGTIASVERYEGTNRNPVFFITFEERLPTGDGTSQEIRGVWKPECVWMGKEEAYFTREVGTYEFDHQFAETGMVPVTVEAILQLPGQQHSEMGSLQYMISNARPLGSDIIHYDPHFDAFRKTASYRLQERVMRTLLYVLGDPDKFANNVHLSPNLQNILVDENGKLWMIDNAYNMGAPRARIEMESILCQYSPAAVAYGRKPSQIGIEALLGVFIEPDFASHVAGRALRAAQDVFE